MKVVIYLLTLFLSWSCSFQSLLISNLDYVAANRVASRMSLYYSQEKELRKDLAKLFNSQKPQVKALVDVFEKNENQKPNIRVLYKTLMQSYREIAFASIDTFVPILGSLNKKQVKEFFEKQVERT